MLDSVMARIVSGELTIPAALELVYQEATSSGPVEPKHFLEEAYKGKNVFIRTVTYHYIGRLMGVRDGEIILEDASWIASSGRWHTALATGVLEEVEPYPGVCCVSLAAKVDICGWLHPLPREAK